MDLQEIKDPTDLLGLSTKDCEKLAKNIRETIIKTVSEKGGHLSSNLGAVEMTIALHRAFATPVDKIVFDVGHQTYTHKLLTGRYEKFKTLRCYKGMSGFPKCAESEYDCFETGHASTAISAALGMARARDLKGEKHHVVSVVGDGALTGGMCYEALNDCGNTKTKLIVVINDNEMSIAKNVGALSKHFAKLRTSWGWYSAKRKVQKGLLSIPWIGKSVEQILYTMKRAVRALFVDETFFSALGFAYLGPIDGHDIAAMEKIFKRAQKMEVPVVIHLCTTKGYGYESAELKPELFHGTPPFLIESGLAQKDAKQTFGDVAVKTLMSMSREDKRIAVITAGMSLGTATNQFQKEFPDRFYDVGIAEEHAVTMCAGLAKGGMLPYFFVYSTFLQRGYDQVMHDVCMQGLPVVFMLDRSGLANGDGQTHQGLFDIAYLRHIPDMRLLAPADTEEMQEMIKQSLSFEGPCAIRYPKKATKPNPAYKTVPFELGKWKTLRNGKDAAFLAVGSMVGTAIEVANTLHNQGIALEVINASTIKPLDGACLKKLAKENTVIFSLEEHITAGGFGSSLLEYNEAQALGLSIHPIAVPNRYITHGDRHSIIEEIGMDVDTIKQSILQKLGKAGEDHER